MLVGWICNIISRMIIYKKRDLEEVYYDFFEELLYFRIILFSVLRSSFYFFGCFIKIKLGKKRKCI